MPRLPPWVQRTRAKKPAYRGWALVDGKRIYGPSRATPNEAYDDARRMRDADAEMPRDHMPTLREAMDLVRQHAADATSKGNQQWLKQQYDLLEQFFSVDEPIGSFTRDDIQWFIRERISPTDEERKPVKPATIRHNLSALGHAFNLAIKQRWIAFNPVVEASRPRVDQAQMDWFTKSELRDLLAEVDEGPDRDLFVLFAYTGVRAGEAADLKCEDVSLRRGELWIGRGKRRPRAIPIDADLSPTLERILRRATGEPLIDDAEAAIRRTFRRWGRRLKERRLHPHALRHTFATMLVQAGVRLDVIQHLLGHTSIKMVLRYVHLHGPEARDAVSRLRILPEPESRRDAASE